MMLYEKLSSGPQNAIWLGQVIQNSITSFFANKVNDMIKHEVHSAQYYTLMADETKDISRSEQLSLVLRYLYNGHTYERFISFTNVRSLHQKLFSPILWKVFKTWIKVLVIVSVSVTMELL